MDYMDELIRKRESMLGKRYSPRIRAGEGADRGRPETRYSRFGGEVRPPFYSALTRGIEEV
jgi:hypothetical protein